MQKSSIPFNVSILELTPRKLEGLRPVTVLDIFDGAGANFHPDGLFSTSTFGKVGDDRRSTRFSYINIKISIFHPVIYRALTTLKRLYAGIIAGTEYALWDEELCDFERSDPILGKTGFSYFVQYWKSIQHKVTKSVLREQNILMLEKYKSIALTSKIIVLPAGMRDLEIGPDGRQSKDEINNFYHSLLAVSNTISESAIKSNEEMLNTARYRLQMTFNELYDTLEAMIEGKKKLLMGKWASRRIFNGTRNVITAMNTSVPYLGQPGTVGINNTISGLYQTMKGMMPIARYQIRNGFLSKIFKDVGAPVTLINKRTRNAEQVNLKTYYFDRWMTDEGVEKVITSFSEESIRHKPLEIEGRYMALIYKGPDNTFKIIQDIDEVPGTRSKLDVFPLTFCELLYLSCYTVMNKYPGFVTRYPITGRGSIYPSKIYVKTTTKSEVRRELNDEWELMDDTHTALEFPITGSPFINSLLPHPSKLDRLAADFDGDTCSLAITYSDESIKEVDSYLKTKKAYIGTDGKFVASVDISTVQLVMYNLTGF